MSEHIRDRCPSCGSSGSLFIGTGGYLTCGLIGCPEPGVGRAIAYLQSRIEELERERDHYRGNVDRWAEEVAARDTRIEELEKDPWWRRISRGDIAAELSATFDIGLDVAVRIADWILSTQKGGQ